jgi:hypothetical protein
VALAVERKGAFRVVSSAALPARASSNRELIEAVMGSFIDRVKAKFAVIGVIGQGYVGLPLALVFSEAGFQVTGFDVDGGKVATLNQGCSYIKHVGSPRVRAVVDSGRFSAQHDSLPVSKSSTPPSVPDQLGGLPALADGAFACAGRVIEIVQPGECPSPGLMPSTWT